MERGATAHTESVPDQPAAAEQVPRQTLVDGVYARIRSAIFSGELRAGAELNQVDLARRFGVSRVPIREALRRLQAERLLVSNPYQRFVVCILAPEQVLELHDIRAELEVFALKQALKLDPAERKARVDAAQAVASRMTVGMDLKDWMMADREFHLALNGPSTAAAGMIEDLRDRVHRYLNIAGYSAKRGKLVLAEHQAILKAVRSGDPTKVETALRVHVDHTRDVLEQALG